jgi:hypothetical protein
MRYRHWIRKSEHLNHPLGVVVFIWVQMYNLQSSTKWRSANTVCTIVTRSCAFFEGNDAGLMFLPTGARLLNGTFLHDNQHLEKTIDLIFRLRKKLVPDFPRRSEDLCSCR